MVASLFFVTLPLRNFKHALFPVSFSFLKALSSCVLDDSHFLGADNSQGFPSALGMHLGGLCPL